MNLPMGAWPLCSLAEMLPRELHRQVSLSKGQLTQMNYGEQPAKIEALIKAHDIY